MEVCTVQANYLEATTNSSPEDTNKEELDMPVPFVFSAARQDIFNMTEFWSETKWIHVAHPVNHISLHRYSEHKCNTFVRGALCIIAYFQSVFRAVRDTPDSVLLSANTVSNLKKISEWVCCHCGERGLLWPGRRCETEEHCGKRCCRIRCPNVPCEQKTQRHDEPELDENRCFGSVHLENEAETGNENYWENRSLRQKMPFFPFKKPQVGHFLRALTHKLRCLLPDWNASAWHLSANQLFLMRKLLKPHPFLDQF